MSAQSRSRACPSDGRGWKRGTLGRAIGAAIAVSLVATSAGGAQEVASEASVDGPLTMARAVRLALDRSRELQDALYGLEIASEQVSEAWSNVFPQLDLNADYTRNLKPAVSFLPAQIFDPSAGPDDYIKVQFGADNSWAASLSLDQKVFDPAVFIGVGAAGRFRALQDETLRGRTQNVVTRVRTAFYDLLLSQEQLRLTSNSLERVRRSLVETKALNRAGLSSDYEVLRLEVQVANLEPNLRRAENQIRADRRALAVELDLGLDGAETLSVAGSLAEIDLANPQSNTEENRDLLRFAGVEDGSFESELPSLIDAALARRSDIRQLELTERLRQTELRLEQVQYLPTVSLFGTYSVNAQQNGSPDFFGSGDLQRAYSALAGVRVSLPVFQGLRRDARIDQKRAALRQSETQTRLVVDQARSQVTSLAEQADEARLRAEGQSLAVVQARRGFDIARAQYREGLSSQLELTDAEVALRESEFNYAQAVYDYLVAQARLDEAIGRVPLVDHEALASTQDR